MKIGTKQHYFNELGFLKNEINTRAFMLRKRPKSVFEYKEGIPESDKPGTPQVGAISKAQK